MKMTMEEEGFDELIKKLNSLSEGALKECAKPALKNVAEKVSEDMKSCAPVSTVRDIHGVDYIGKTGIRTAKSGYYSYTDVGFSTTISGHGEAYWNAVRGLWFQEFKIDEPNYGWYSRNILAKKDVYQKELEENLIIQIRQHFFNKF